ncbi:unnamed protein product [Rhodiola kirilowii]
MEQPEGCRAPGQERKVCKLVKSLYGLKQAPNSGMRSLTKQCCQTDSKSTSVTNVFTSKTLNTDM